MHHQQHAMAMRSIQFKRIVMNNSGIFARLMNTAFKGHMALLGAQIIYALNYSIAKGLMPTFIDPMALVFFRITGATILFWLLSAFTGLQPIDKKDRVKLLLLPLFGVVVNQIFFIYGLSQTTPINSAIIMISNPVMVFLFMLFITRERIGGIQVSGLLLAITGAVLLLRYRGNFELGSETVTGDIMTLINSTSWAIFIVMAKPIMLRYNTITAMSWMFLVGSIIMLPIGLPSALATNFSAFTPHAWFALGFVVIATTFFAYLLNLYGLQMLSPGTVSAYIYLQPLLASLFAVIMGEDLLTPTKLFSGILIIAGLFLVNSKIFKKE